MQITREMLEARRATLQADLHAVSGALQDVDYWLARLDEADEDEA